MGPHGPCARRPRQAMVEATSGDGAGRSKPSTAGPMHIPAIPRVTCIRRRFSRRAGSRGQSLVEFAMALPILLFLTLIALDFGRVYLGYINLQNMTRIAANYAANHPTAWSATPNTTDQTRYRNQILADATATNCRLPQSAGSPVVATPTFTDGNGDGSSTTLGDTVRVNLSCTFQVITPGVSAIVGGSVAVSSSAQFPVKAGMSG